MACCGVALSPWLSRVCCAINGMMVCRYAGPVQQLRARDDGPHRAAARQVALAQAVQRPLGARAARAVGAGAGAGAGAGRCSALLLDVVREVAQRGVVERLVAALQAVEHGRDHGAQLLPHGGARQEGLERRQLQAHRAGRPAAVQPPQGLGLREENTPCWFGDGGVQALAFAPAMASRPRLIALAAAIA